MTSDSPPVLGLLRRYRPRDPEELADVERARSLAADCADPWDRALPLHLTASALVVHPAGGSVLLRWHERQQAWLQIGGHGDPGEHDALAIALREGAEETGLPDLSPWPDAALQQVVIVGVPAGKGEPGHEHADLRFLLATGNPDAARAENPGAPLRWLTAAAAAELTREANLRVLIGRAGLLLRG